MKMKYDLEAAWILLTTCNFRCTYCFFTPALLGERLTTHGTHAQWKEGFGATGKTCLIHITGGEPSIYPGFADLCEQLSQNHYLSINSNLSHHSIEAFAERVNPERVHYINAGVHVEERQKKAALGVFIDRVHKLQKCQFTVLISALMTPQIIHDFPTISKEFESHGLYPIPKVMRGVYERKRYPAGYSIAEKSLILQYLGEAREQYRTVIERMGEPATIDMFSDDHFLNGIPDYRGKLCSSGYNFVRVDPDGTVFRCGSRERLGNILLKNIRLLSAAKLCDTSYCPYFCEKYSLPQPAGVNTIVRRSAGINTIVRRFILNVLRGFVENKWGGGWRGHDKWNVI
ncbi:MAG TPA: radical SAM protein [Thermodesulfobacteriota bacterium]|nr:radical SAM protein [Thermodesulfobacteriota bacterium]